MIDANGLIVDGSGDGGDACNFTCTGIILGLYDSKPTVKYNATRLFWNNGEPRRHPYQAPWNNPKNFTRDQAIPLMWVLNPNDIAAFLQRNPCFFPNTERDAVGTKKYPWPHFFTNDQGQREFRWFDYADPMTPDFVGMCHLLMDEPHHWSVPLGRFLVRHSIEDHCLKAKTDPEYNDFKQLYFTAKAYGLHKDFAEAHPRGLYHAAWKYFSTWRNLPELEKAFIKEFTREGIKE